MNPQLIDIKKELRANMNGIASAASRQTEDYRVNWGIEMPRLMDIAKEFAPSRELAQALWSEATRECKILGCMLMPFEEYDADLCDIWAESIRTHEIAMYFVLYLVRRLPFAADKAYEWMAQENRLKQSMGYLTMCHLLRNSVFSDTAIDEFLDQAAASLDNTDAIKALQIFASLSEENTKKVKKIADFLM